HASQFDRTEPCPSEVRPRTEEDGQTIRCPAWEAVDTAVLHDLVRVAAVRVHHPHLVGFEAVAVREVHDALAVRGVSRGCFSPSRVSRNPHELYRGCGTCPVFHY